MLTETLDVSNGSELMKFALIIGVLLAGALLGGLSNYCLQSAFAFRDRVNLGRELLIGLICATVLPCLLWLVSSGLLDLHHLSPLEMLRLFATTILFVLGLGQMLFGIFHSVSQQQAKYTSLSLVEVEIMRAIEHQETKSSELPVLPQDIRLPPALLSERMAILRGRGYINVRDASDGGETWTVTREGWDILNETLRHATAR